MRSSELFGGRHRNIARNEVKLGTEALRKRPNPWSADAPGRSP